MNKLTIAGMSIVFALAACEVTVDTDDNTSDAGETASASIGNGNFDSTASGCGRGAGLRTGVRLTPHPSNAG